MRVVLVQPPYSSDYLEEREPPLGILSIATVLWERGYWVQIRDLQRSVRLGHLPLDDGFYALACDLILADSPDVVGFTAMSVSLPSALLVAREIKARRPDVRVVFGGPQVTLCADLVMSRFPWVDIIVRGEGEATVVELLEAFEGRQPLSSVSGIHYRDAGELSSTPNRPVIEDLDTLLPIRYDLLEDLAYYKKEEDGLPSMPIDSGRGCPWGCTFCSTSLVWRRKFRLKSMPRLLSEMQALRERYGILAFSLQHDMFTTVRKLVVEFCEGLIAANNTLHWGCSSRVDMVDSELLHLMAQAGCRSIFFGVESASPELQNDMKKHLDVSLVLPVVKECADLKIAATTSFIIGFPEETEEQLNETLEMAVACKALGANNVQLHVLIPESGTALAQQVQERLVLREDHLRASRVLVIHAGVRELELVREHPDIFAAFYNIQPTHLSITWLYELASTFRLLIYLYPRTIWLALQSTHTRPLDLLRRFKDWLGQGEADLIVTDLADLQRQFAPFLGTLLSEVTERHRQLVQAVFDYENAGAALKASVVERPQWPARTRSGEFFFLPSSAKLIRVGLSIARLMEGIRQGLSLDELAENRQSGWVLYMTWGQRVRLFIGLSELKAHLVACLQEGARTLPELQALARERWPSIAAEPLGAQVRQALEQMVEAGVIGDQDRLRGPAAMLLT